MEVPEVEIEALCAYVEMDLESGIQMNDSDWRQSLAKVRSWLDAVEQSRAADGASPPKYPKVGCEDCGHPYENFALDVTLSDPQWLAIHPSGRDGLLCARCIVARASKLENVIAVRAVIEIASPRR